MPKAAQNLIQTRFIQQVPAVPILDLQNPEVRIHIPLPADCALHRCILTVEQYHPAALSGRQIERSLKSRRGPIEAVEFYQNGSRRVVAPRDNKGRNIRQTTARQVSRNPAFGREPGSHVSSRPRNRAPSPNSAPPHQASWDGL